VANTIQIKRSSTASDTPSASDLAVGELAVNTADAKLFTKHTDGTVKELAGGGGSGISAVVDDTSPQLGGNLDTNDKNIQFGDSSGATVNRLQLGASQDLEIYHDGSNSFIKNSTGTLLFRNQIFIQNQFGTENIAKFIPNGAVELYHDNSKKLETTSSGINILGNINLEPNSGSFRDIGFGTTDDTTLVLAGGGSSGVTAGNIELVRNGNINIDGTNINLRAADASSTFATINSSGATVTGDLTLTSTDTGATENPTLDLYRNSASPAANDVIGHINFSGEDSAGNKDVYAKINVDIIDPTSGSEDARLDLGVVSTGNIQNRIVMTGNGSTQIQNRDLLLTQNVDLIFEGSTNDGNETTLTVTDPTADRTITLPDASGTVLLNTGDQSITGDLTLTSTDGGATVDPSLILHRESASPADFDVIGNIQFDAENSASEQTTYAQIYSQIVDQTDGTEDGYLQFWTKVGGTDLVQFRIGFSTSDFYGNVRINPSNIFSDPALIFEGATSNDFETFVKATDPTADRTITLPDATGTTVLTSLANADASRGIIAVAVGRFDSNGSTVKASNLSCSRTSTGNYTLTFGSARPDANYTIIGQIIESDSVRDDIKIHIQDGSQTTTAFNINIYEGDNGGSPDTFRDRKFYIVVYDF